MARHVNTPFKNLVSHLRVVVKRTFIEVHSDEDDDEEVDGISGLGRRACSDSALFDLTTGLHGAGKAAEAGGSFEMRGLSETETCSETAEAATALQDDSEGSVASCPLRPGLGSDLPNATPLYDGAFERSISGPAALSPFGPVPGGASAAAAAPGAENFEQLLSENARLSRENELLRERARLLAQFRGAETALFPAASAPGAVPQSIEDDQEQPEEGEPTIPPSQRTTVMLRNVPNNYSRTMLLAMLDDGGFAGCYDFVYLPVDFNSGACLGYAFVNLVGPHVVQPFWSAFDGYARWILPSRKVCRVGWSGPHQGLEAHIARYRNSPVMHASVPDEYKPVLLANGWRVAFPGPTKTPRAPRIRHRGDAGLQRHGRHAGRRR